MSELGSDLTAMAEAHPEGMSGLLSSVYDPLTEPTMPSIKVAYLDDTVGKGLFATRDISAGARVLNEAPLLSMVHTPGVLPGPSPPSCAYCLRALGPIERIINALVVPTQPAESEPAESEPAESEPAESEPAESEPAESEPAESEPAASASASAAAGADVEPLPHNSLPFAEQLLPSLPPLPVPCRCAEDGCPDVYCSEACASIVWSLHHELLCRGKAAADVKAAKAVVAAAEDAAEAAAEAAHAAEDAALLRKLSLDRLYTAVIPNENEAFYLVAQALAHVVLRFRAAQAAPSAAPSAAPPSLTDAWLPFGLIRKDMWEAVAVSGGSGSGGGGGGSGGDSDEYEYEYESDEEAFIEALQRNIAAAVPVLRGALFDGTEELEPLFDPSVVSRLMGMLEMNSLSMLAPTPLEAYLDAANKLPEKEWIEVLARGGGTLAALSPELISRDVEGVGLFLVQSNVNHSCAPNVESIKDTFDVDGRAVLYAVHDIAAGEQLFVSYIDESLDYAERTAELAEYHFECGCPKCTADRARLALDSPSSDAVVAESNPVYAAEEPPAANATPSSKQ